MIFFKRHWGKILTGLIGLVFGMTILDRIMLWPLYQFCFEAFHRAGIGDDHIAAVLSLVVVLVAAMLGPYIFRKFVLRRTTEGTATLLGVLIAWELLMYFVSLPPPGEYFNPVSGAPRYRYGRDFSDEVDMFPLGHCCHPQTGQKLVLLTPEAAQMIVPEYENQCKECGSRGDNDRTKLSDDDLFQLAIETLEETDGDSNQALGILRQRRGIGLLGFFSTRRAMQAAVERAQYEAEHPPYTQTPVWVSGQKLRRTVGRLEALFTGLQYPTTYILSDPCLQMRVIGVRTVREATELTLEVENRCRDTLILYDASKEPTSTYLVPDRGSSLRVEMDTGTYSAGERYISPSERFQYSVAFPGLPPGTRSFRFFHRQFGDSTVALGEDQLASSTVAVARFSIDNSQQQPNVGRGGLIFRENDPLHSRFGWYADALHRRLADEWKRALTGMRRRSDKPVRIVFLIVVDGSIQNPRIAQSSGHSSLDYSALRAVINSNPLPALPKDLGRRSIEVEMKFSPNETKYFEQGSRTGEGKVASNTDVKSRPDAVPLEEEKNVDRTRSEDQWLATPIPK